jgi:hypothetical protein
MIEWEKLISLLDYNMDTGIFTWKVNRGSKHIGDTAGGLTSEGYSRLMVDGIEYRAHRLAWFYCFKEWPELEIDHIDGNRSNNRLDNLREATRTENSYNTGIKSTNITGIKGITFYKRTGKYQAKIRIKGKVTHLGYFDSADKAKTAYEQKAKEIQGEFFNASKHKSTGNN